jgi:O-antigen ligase
LGTSREANANFHGADVVSHNLYTEAAEELGYVGLALSLALIWSFLSACRAARRAIDASLTTDVRLRFLRDVADALLAVVAVDLFFSFASYGLSEPYWYFVGGLSVVTARIAEKLAPQAVDGRTGAHADGPAGRNSHSWWRGRVLTRRPAPGSGMR